MEFILEWSLDAFIETKPDMNEIAERLRLFMNNEARSCSMDNLMVNGKRLMIHG